MPVVVGVSFRPVTKVYYFDPGVFMDLTKDEYVVVETSQGNEIGQVAWQPRAVADSALSGELKPVVRRATPVELLERDRFRRREGEALTISRQEAAKHKLPLTVVSAEYSYDGSRLVVSFTAEGRIDFRDLVRDLARIFNARIEMKQIGVRDQAKVLDGVGKCGRQLCCAGWLREFDSVTIKMAKQQNLPLNPPEISGVCGRLLCCLAYEVDAYEDARKQLPKVGAAVSTPAGEGRVRRVQPLQEIITVKLEDGSMQDFSMAELNGEKPAGAPAVEKTTGRTCGGCAMRRQPALRVDDNDEDPIVARSEDAPSEGSASTASRRSRGRRGRHRPGRPGAPA
ncbi:MAG: stage 0 sporulation family protein [Anaerolineae bacterium]